MNKSEILPEIHKILDPLLFEEGYRYLKSQEKYQKKEQGVRLCLDPNITYWPNSNYCMVSPRISVHVDAIEDYYALHSGQNVDRHSPTLTLLCDNIEGAQYWSISSRHELHEVTDEIVITIKTVLLPLLESWSNPKKVAIEGLNNRKSLFFSELHRLTTLFAYCGVYNDIEMLKSTIESVNLERVSCSRMQLDPHYLEILRSMKSDIPLIGDIGIDL
ncbi:hypothetical protein [Sessilibacter corallicola]|uniref:hypothetical protein n=1 Tax=Sessilibacter corallicola TaxID=2904075 RepID=UPI001E52D29D|nr:hypothetical protein [Sessilibacter corallicola]MCE2029462.1 hypothetical protein [Sessilibacter corallicola]